MRSSQVTYAVADNIATLSIHRPPVNALSLDFLDDILSALERAGDDDDVRAVILCSTLEERFSAGLDLDILLGKSVQDVRAFLERLYLQLWDTQCSLGKPTIAVVNGAARGGGMTLAISCDIILASDTASFGYPEIDLGLLPAIHLSHLPRLIGRSRAFELLFTGRTFSAEEARQLGLVTKVHPDTALMEEASRLAAIFASKPAEAIRAGRAALVRINDKDYRDDILLAIDEFCAIATSPSAQEGLRAFLEKRKPNWQA